MTQICSKREGEMPNIKTEYAMLQKRKDNQQTLSPFGLCLILNHSCVFVLETISACLYFPRMLTFIKLKILTKMLNFPNTFM